MINSIFEYLSAFLIVQFCFIPLFILFIFWSARYSNFRMQRGFLHIVFVAGFILPSFFLISPEGGSRDHIPGSLPGTDEKLIGEEFSSAGVSQKISEAVIYSEPLVMDIEPSTERTRAFSAFGTGIFSTLLLKGGSVLTSVRKKLMLAGPFLLAGILSGILLFILRYRRHSRIIRNIRKGGSFSSNIIGESRYTICRSRNIPVPFSSGLHKPVIYLPAEFLEGEESSILFHEASHIENGHILWIWIFELYTSLLWYYPVSFFMKKQNIRLQELLADEQTLQRTESVNYAKTLIKCAEVCSLSKSKPLFAVSAVSGNHFTERIKLIIDAKRRNPGFLSKAALPLSFLITGGLVLLLLSCSRADAVQDSDFLADEPVSVSLSVSTEVVTPDNDLSVELNKLLREPKASGSDGASSSPTLDRLSEIIRTESSSGLPVLWPLGQDRGRITLPFGPAGPITGLQNGPWIHKGVDIAARTGTEILAAGDGIVAGTGYEPETYGNYIILHHDYGFSTIYTHLKEVNIRMDQEIDQGEVIGLLGNTGASTGPHLHFALSLTPASYTPGEGFQNTHYIDPMKLTRTE